MAYKKNVSEVDTFFDLPDCNATAVVWCALLALTFELSQTDFGDDYVKAKEDIQYIISDDKCCVHSNSFPIVSFWSRCTAVQSGFSEGEIHIQEYFI